MPDDKRDAPAYVAWKTFLTATNQLEGALPPKLDTSVFPSHAGSVKGQLLSTFRFLGFTESDGTVTQALRSWVDDQNNRPELMQTVLREKYSNLLDLASQNATPRQMHEVFSKMGVTGSTLRKAVTFFVKACEFADVTIPASWTRTGTIAPSSAKGDGARKPRRKPRGEVEGQASGVTAQGERDGDSLSLRSGGTVTLTVDASMLRLSPEDRDWLFGLIDHFRSYAGNAGDHDEPDDE